MKSELSVRLKGIQSKEKAYTVINEVLKDHSKERKECLEWFEKNAKYLGIKQ